MENKTWQERFEESWKFGIDDKQRKASVKYLVSQLLQEEREKSNAGEKMKIYSDAYDKAYKIGYNAGYKLGREELRKEMFGKIEDYFKGLIAITDPQATKDKLLTKLND